MEISAATKTLRNGSALVVVLMLSIVVVVTRVAGAAEAPVGLGTAESFAVMGGQAVTNTGPSVLNGDLGICPGAATDITGFPPGTVNGTTYAANGVACGAQADITTAYNDAAGRAPSVLYPGPIDLGGGTTLLPGVYKSPSTMAITGTLTLDGQANPDSVFIFQAASTLITAVNSNVVFLNGAHPCNVFWQVGSSATLGVGSTFVGTVLALTSIAANTNAVITGRLLARNGATTLHTNTITRAPCAATTTTAASTATTATSAVTTTSTAAAATTATTATAAAPTAPGAMVNGVFVEAPTTAALNQPTVDAPVTVGLSPNSPTGFGSAGLGGGGGGATATAGTPTTTAETARGFARTGATVGWTTLAGGLALLLGSLLLVTARQDGRQRLDND